MEDITTRAVLRQYIEALDLQDAFPEDVWGQLKLHRYQDGESVTVAGEKLLYFCVIVDGKAKVSPSSEEGKVILLNYLQPMDLLGDVEFFLDCDCFYTVQAVGALTMLAVSRYTLITTMMEQVSFLQFLCKSLTRKLVSHSDSYSRSLLYQRKGLLCQYLLQISEGQQSDTISYCGSEVSQYLGITDRHLRRLVAEYVNAGVLQKDKGVITLLDKDRLRQDATHIGE